MTGGSDAASVVDTLRATLLERLRSVVPEGCRVALLDFPNHANVGDTAIWLGEVAALRELGCEVAYVASVASFSPAVLHRKLGADGVILLHGGGNFGDIWTTFQRFRERLWTRHVLHRIVQLPQTIHFADSNNLAATAASLARHPDFHLLVRDEASLKVCREHLPTATAMLCPDAAFALGPLRAAPATRDIHLLLRGDAERRADLGEVELQDVWRADWREPSVVLRRAKTLSRALGYPLKRVGAVAAPLDDPLQRLYAAMAARRLGDGLDDLSAARVVVTDRLHGHILCLLLGRPHVLLDNSYGKNRNFYDQWTSGARSAAWAENLPQALGLARQMLQAAPR